MKQYVYYGLLCISFFPYSFYGAGNVAFDNDLVRDLTKIASQMRELDARARTQDTWDAQGYKDAIQKTDSLVVAITQVNKKIQDKRKNNDSSLHQIIKNIENEISEVNKMAAMENKKEELFFLQAALTPGSETLNELITALTMDNVRLVKESIKKGYITVQELPSLVRDAIGFKKAVFKSLAFDEKLLQVDIEAAKREIAKLDRETQEQQRINELERQIQGVKKEIAREDLVSPQESHLTPGHKKSPKRVFRWKKVGPIVSGYYENSYNPIQTAKLSPDGLMVAVVSHAGGCMLYDVAAGDPVRAVGSGQDYFSSVDFLNANKLVTTGGTQAGATNICVWDIVKNVCAQSIVMPTMIRKVAMSAHHDKMAVVLTNGSVVVVDLDHTNKAPKVIVQSGAYNAALSQNGRSIVVSGDDGVRLINMHGALIRNFAYDGFASVVAIDKQGKKIAVANNVDREITVWNAHSGVIEGVLGGYKWEQDAQGQKVRKVIGHTHDIIDLAFSPDGQQLLSASRDATAYLWTLKNKIGRVLYASDTWIQAADFNNDGSVLMVADKRSVNTWKKELVHQKIDHKRRAMVADSKESKVLQQLEQPKKLLRWCQQIMQSAPFQGLAEQEQKQITSYMRYLTDTRSDFSPAQLKPIETYIRTIS